MRPSATRRSISGCPKKPGNSFPICLVAIGYARSAAIAGNTEKRIFLAGFRSKSDLPLSPSGNGWEIGKRIPSYRGKAKRRSSCSWKEKHAMPIGIGCPIGKRPPCGKRRIDPFAVFRHHSDVRLRLIMVWRIPSIKPSTEYLAPNPISGPPIQARNAARWRTGSD
jgi:hypothetical protein